MTPSAPTSFAPRSTTTAAAPALVLMSSARSGIARRVDGYISHLLQRRHNHGAFRYRIVNIEDQPELFANLKITEIPTLLVVDDSGIAARADGNLKPAEIELLLRRWLR